MVVVGNKFNTGEILACWHQRTCRRPCIFLFYFTAGDRERDKRLERWNLELFGGYIKECYVVNRAGKGRWKMFVFLLPYPRMKNYGWWDDAQRCSVSWPCRLLLQLNAVGGFQVGEKRQVSETGCPNEEGWYGWDRVLCCSRIMMVMLSWWVHQCSPASPSGSCCICELHYSYPEPPRLQRFWLRGQ